jgi:hypothetical protein
LDLQRFGIEDRLSETDTRWMIPSAVALYGISRFGRFMQNTRHGETMSRIDVFRENGDNLTVNPDFVTGAINTLGDLDETRRFLTDDTNSSFWHKTSGANTPLEKYLYGQEPSIPRSESLTATITAPTRRL